jgi:predicted transposase/invertase (TIGR01784 family)
MVEEEDKMNKDNPPVTEVFMNIKTDYGFKKVFADKELLIAFLNELTIFPEQIKDIKYLPLEQLGYIEKIRRAVYDIYVETESGKFFIVEMQLSTQQHFAERMIFYASHSIIKQVPKGKQAHDEEFKISGIFIVAILDFVMFNEKVAENIVIERVELMRLQADISFFDKYKFVIVELPKFKKTLNEVSDDLMDGLLYSFLYMEHLDECPEVLCKNIIIKKLYERAKINKLTAEEMKAYQESVLEYSGLRYAIDLSREEGRKEGLEEGLEKGRMKGLEEAQRKMVKRFYKRGKSIKDIAEEMDLTEEQVYFLLE